MSLFLGFYYQPLFLSKRQKIKKEFKRHVYGRYATAGQVMTKKSQNIEREELNTCLLGVASNNVSVIAGAAIARRHRLCKHWA